MGSGVLPNTTLIVSIYKDVVALNAILEAIKNQTLKPTELIISEDGDDLAVARFIREAKKEMPKIVHLTQPDEGFRKNRALNRAIAVSSCDYLIFIDGDCVPHRHFVESHVSNAQHGAVCAGRRVEVGPVFSELIRRRHIFMRILQNPVAFILLMPLLLLDGIKNPESGIYSRFIHYAKGAKKKISIVGCNFSCFKSDLIEINGFNEAYQSAGLGEDSDIEFRLVKNNVVIKNIKFLATQYHLHHKRSYIPEVNRELYERVLMAGEIRCKRGVDQYL